MKKEYIQPETTVYVIASGPYCDNPGLHGTSGDPGDYSKDAGGEDGWEDEDDF